MKIEDLRLPCDHGWSDNPHWPDACEGFRVPTRQELIDSLGIDYEAAHDKYLALTGSAFTVAMERAVDAALGLTDD